MRGGCVRGCEGGGECGGGFVVWVGLGGRMCGCVGVGRCGWVLVLWGEAACEVGASGVGWEVCLGGGGGGGVGGRAGRGVGRGIGGGRAGIGVGRAGGSVGGLGLGRAGGSATCVQTRKPAYQNVVTPPPGPRALYRHPRRAMSRHEITRDDVTHAIAEQ